MQTDVCRWGSAIWPSIYHRTLQRKIILHRKYIKFPYKNDTIAFTIFHSTKLVWMLTHDRHLIVNLNHSPTSHAANSVGQLKNKQWQSQGACIHIWALSHRMFGAMVGWFSRGRGLKPMKKTTTGRMKAKTEQVVGITADKWIFHLSAAKHDASWCERKHYTRWLTKYSIWIYIVIDNAGSYTRYLCASCHLWRGVSVSNATS